MLLAYYIANSNKTPHKVTSTDFGWTSHPPPRQNPLLSAWLQTLEFDQALNKPNKQRKMLMWWKKYFLYKVSPFIHNAGLQLLDIFKNSVINK